MQSRLRVLLLAAVSVMAFSGAAAGTTSVAGASGDRYLVVYKGAAIPKDAAASIAKAGGTLVYSYDQIGVAVASSTSTSFATPC